MVVSSKTATMGAVEDFLRRTSMGRLVLLLFVLYLARRSKADWWCLWWCWAGGRRWVVDKLVSLSGIAPDIVGLADMELLLVVAVVGAFVCDEDSRCARECRLGSGLVTPVLLVVLMMTSGLRLLSSLPGRWSEPSVSVAGLLAIENLRLVLRLELSLESMIGYRSFM